MAAMMSVTELLENAVKYGDVTPEMPRISLEVSVNDGLLRLQVCSGVTRRRQADQLAANLDRLAAAEDKSSLYLEAIEKTAASSKENAGGLGLYRIAAEGRFDIRCTFENRMVRITATRRIA